jgi:hypothetical protein
MTLIIQKPTGAKLNLRKGWQPMDADAAAYITAVETADGQALEERTKIAIDNFVLGCKADGIWPAIKASCILAGARTLGGALVPLAGTAPTNFNFVSGDYNRKTGLGNADNTTKYLDTNRAGNADPQNSFHLSVFLSTQPNPDTSQNYSYLAGPRDLTGSNLIARSGTTAGRFFGQSRSNTGITVAGTADAGFVGSSRALSTGFVYRVAGANATANIASQTPNSSTIEAFRWINAGTPTAYAKNKIPFYSIGESLDLALLDARVTDLINAFAAAIP